VFLDHIIILGEAHLRRILFPVPLITTPSGRIDLCTRIHRFFQPFIRSE
jgi:hypothetical protein